MSDYNSYEDGHIDYDKLFTALDTARADVHAKTEELSGALFDLALADTPDAVVSLVANEIATNQELIDTLDNAYCTLAADAAGIDLDEDLDEILDEADEDLYYDEDEDDWS